MEVTKKYNHLFSIGFSVVSHHEADEVTVDELRTALLKRIVELDEHHEWHEAAMDEGDTTEEAV